MRNLKIINDHTIFHTIIVFVTIIVGDYVIRRFILLVLPIDRYVSIANIDTSVV